MILITNPVFQTVVFAIILFCFLCITIRKKKYSSIFPNELTVELKGFAILLIIFSHIGYILSSTDKFLWPLSTMAGVGVNLFLFLSGYGLTISALKKRPRFKKTGLRLLKLFIPVWLVLLVFFTLDYFVLHTTYTSDYVVHSFAGIFLRADSGLDINSPLWYFTVVLFYYLLFPIIFIKRHAWISALLLIIISTIIVKQDPVRLHDVMRLYQVHTLAFPLGMVIASLGKSSYVKTFIQNTNNAYKNFLQRYQYKKLISQIVYYLFLLALVVLIGYCAIHSGVEQKPLKEQIISLVAMSAIILVFIMKRFTVGILSLFGVVSFEIYLLHWPLMSRYDYIYAHFVPWLATSIYLALFVLFGYVLKNISDWLLRILQNKIKAQ